MTIKAIKSYAGTFSGAKSFKVVRHSKAGRKCGQIVRLYIGRKCYADLEATPENYLAAQAWARTVA